MKSIQKHLDLLKLLSSAKPKQRVAIIKTASPSQIRCLCEICKNVLAGNVPIDVPKLKKFKTTIRYLSKRNIPLRKRKQILINQKGGFLPLVLPGVISLLGSFLGKAFNQNN